MTRKSPLVDKLIADRRLEEFRENIKAGTELMADQTKFQRVAAHAYVGLAKIWHLPDDKAASLLDVSNETYTAFLKEDAARLGAVELEKISCLLGIYKYLATLYSGHFDRVGAWLLKPNNGHLFGRKTPYELLNGADCRVFHVVRREVAARTQGI